MRALLLLLAVLPVARASTPADVRRCLAANDVPCAETALDQLTPAAAKSAEGLALAAETAFYGGRYDDAYARIQEARNAGFVDPYDELGLYQRTADVMHDWAEVRAGNHVVRYRPGVDAILLEDALEVLGSSERHITPLLGGPPPGPTILELYPDGRSFVAASSLSKEAVETTGVVALSKWSRLLLTSPRALGRGYEWKDTVAHEYVHLVVAHHTDDNAPVWLQEAIARYLDNRWRDGRDHFRLSVRDQGQLATALREEQGQIDPEKQKAVQKAREQGLEPPHVGLVPFERMHPSLALLPSADMAMLAYAQLASLMDFCFEKSGEDVLERLFPRLKAGEDPMLALAKEAGFRNFDVLQREWRTWVSAQHLEGKVIAELPTVLDGTDEAASDPVMSGREDLQRYLRLGDLLREEKRPDAALVEYAKAVVPGEPLSPLLSNRQAQAWLELGKLDEARAALEESLESYPEFALSYKTLGEIQVRQGQSKAALGSYRRAADLNPYDPAVQAALVELHRGIGDTAGVERHERYVRILRRGGQELAEVKLIRETTK